MLDDRKICNIIFRDTVFIYVTLKVLRHNRSSLPVIRRFIMAVIDYGQQPEN
jgi:hypothetical protein